MTKEINPSEVNEDDLLADINEEQVHVPENKVDNVKISLSVEPANADWADGDQLARLEQDNTNDSLLLDIEQNFSAQEDTGPPISQKLADIINKRRSERLGNHKPNEKREKYHRPMNCEHVIVPQVNPEIWVQIDHNTRQLNFRATAIQTNLVKVGAILAQSTDKLFSLAQMDVSCSEIKALITRNTDAMALLGHDLNRKFPLF